MGTQGELVAGGLDAAMDCLLKYCVSDIVGFCPQLSCVQMNSIVQAISRFLHDHDLCVGEFYCPSDQQVLE
jgi:hypothetical protein